MKSKSSSNNVINFYSKIPESKQKKYESNAGLNPPFRLLVVGSSGSGKSNTVINLIYNMPNYFYSISIITKNADEPLYNFLKKKLGDSVCIYEGLDDIPPLDSYDKSVPHLVIFDDLVLEKNQDKIIEYFVRGRKLNISTVYISQSYFRTPKTIRANINYLILKKISSNRDLGLILNDYSLGVSKEQLYSIYKYATKNKFDFLLIDIDAPEEERFRHNFGMIIETS
jgi:GTPase SAR1 family protein